MKIKVYRFDSDFCAAKNLRDAIREYMSCAGGTIREALEIVETLTDEQMEKFVFYDDIEDIEECDKRSFKEQLEIMIAEGEEFPTLFATSEY